LKNFQNIFTSNKKKYLQIQRPRNEMFLEEKNYNENPKNFLMPFYQALISKLEA
jgi:hypothetical protein